MSETTPPLDSQQAPPMSSMRPRPMPPPRHMRRRWRYRSGIITGAVIMALALSTLYFRAPEDDSKTSDEALPPAPMEELGEDIPPQLPEIMVPDELEPYESYKPYKSSEPFESLQEESAPITEPITEPIMESKPTPEPAPEPMPESVPKSVPESMSSYFVQLSSERGETIAQRRFIMLQRDHPDLLAELSATIKEVDLGRRGIFYRLYVGPFSGKQAAKTLCAALKKRGNDCLVRKP